MFASYFKKAARSKVRRIMRGYRKLKNSKDPFVINRLQEELTVLNLGINPSHISKYIYGEEANNIELSARQFMLQRHAGSRLSKAILLALGSNQSKVYSPVPVVWINKIQEQGIPVSKAHSIFLFGLSLVYLLCVGLVRAGQAVLIRSKPDSCLGSHVQFVDIEKNNLPRKKSDQSYDLVSWYIQWEERINDINEIRHTVLNYEDRTIHGIRLVSSQDYLPGISGFMNKLYFCAWVFVAFLIAAFSLFNGRWANALLFPEAIARKMIELAKSKKLAADYLFSLSAFIYRPLWTYVAERKGSQITLYNYAASFPQFKMKDRYPYSESGYQSVSWPRMLYWSESYAEYTQAIISPKVNIKMVPPIWYTDSDEEIPVRDRPCIALFDVTPVRSYIEKILLPTPVYRTYKMGRFFLEEIYSLANAHGYDLLWKRKRNFYANHNRAYIKFAESFSLLPGVIAVSPEISPFRIVERCVASISMPFTSTALISKDCNVSAIFYDPSGILFKDDRGCQNIPLVSGSSELAIWFNELTLTHSKL